MNDKDRDDLLFSMLATISAALATLVAFNYDKIDNLDELQRLHSLNDRLMNMAKLVVDNVSR